ncbi:MAG: RodZ domain-containing protein [Geminicoccaceae bacterium]
MILAGSVVLGVIAGWLYLGDTAKFDLIAAPVTAGAVDDVDDGNETVDDSLKKAEQALAELEEQFAQEKAAETESSPEDTQNSLSEAPTIEQQQAPDETTAKQEIPANVLATLVAKQGNGAEIYEPDNTDARVIVRALATSWIQVSSGDRSYLWTRTMQPEEMLLVPNRDDLELWAGDASGVELLLDGVVLPTIGPPGTVVRGLSLAPASLEAITQTVDQAGSKKPTF